MLIGDKDGKKLMDAAAKAGIDADASISVAQNTAAAIRDLIGNKIADKITSSGRTKSTGKKKFTYHQKTDSK